MICSVILLDGFGFCLRFKWLLLGRSFDPAGLVVLDEVHLNTKRIERSTVSKSNQKKQACLRGCIVRVYASKCGCTCPDRFVINDCSRYFFG